MATGVLATLLLCLAARTSWGAQVRWGSIERAHARPPPYGPQSPSAPLPPQGPFAPGEAHEQLPPPARAPAAGPLQAPSAESSSPSENSVGAPGERQPPIESDAERPVPDYDGLRSYTTAGDVAIWVPRILLSPLYLVSEYVVRRPLGFAITEAERHYWPQTLVEFFTWDDKKAGVVPHGLVDFGLRPSVGLYLYWDDFLEPGNELRALGATGGLDWWRLTVTDRVPIAPRQKLIPRVDLNIRPDWVFHGIGPESRQRDVSRFRRDLYEAGLGYKVYLWRTSAFESAVAVRDVTIHPNVGCCGDRTLSEAVAEGLFASPPVLHGYTVLGERVAVTLDTRKKRYSELDQTGQDFVAPPGTGVKLMLRGAHSAGKRKRSVDPNGFSRLEWFDYGATLGGYVDLTGQQRTLGLELVGDFADPAPHHEIPFTELPTLGGYYPLQGFLPGRFVDRSSVAARLSYTWPIWVLLDGVIRYEVGNVFGPGLEGFEPGRLRSSYSIGIGASNRRDHNLELLVGMGTKTFRDGAGYDHLRVSLGVTADF